MTNALTGHDAASSAALQYVTVRVGPQLFGIPIETVHEVFAPQVITKVPLSPAAIEGVLNLRGRILTMVNMRRQLGLKNDETSVMAVSIEYQGESFGLMIDSVGEVLTLEAAKRESNPSNLDGRWASISSGVHRLSNELMLVLDVDVALDDARRASAESATPRH